MSPEIAVKRFALLSAFLSVVLPILSAPRAAQAQRVPDWLLDGSNPARYVVAIDTLADGGDAAPTASLGPDAERELEAAFAIVRRTSLWRDTVTWGRVEADVRAAAAGSQSAEDTYPALQLLLARLGDHHSFLMRPQRAAAFGTEGAANPWPTVRVQADGVGYIAIPAYSGGDHLAVRSYVRAAYDSLAHTVANGAGACRWIIDLRGNTGGNMWPMLGALHSFVGEAELGTFVTAGMSGPAWRAGDRVDVTLPEMLAPLDSANVAVLVGPRTASSGEAVAIAFVGRERTRSFGLPTAGLSTGNVPVMLPDGAMLVVTTAVDADRTGTQYTDGIVPDEMIPDAPVNAADGRQDDPQMDRAVAWLASQSCAQHPARGAALAGTTTVVVPAGQSFSDSAGTRGRRR